VTSHIPFGDLNASSSIANTQERGHSQAVAIDALGIRLVRRFDTPGKDSTTS
jgi:hypothetical protein